MEAESLDGRKQRNVILPTRVTLSTHQGLTVVAPSTATESYQTAVVTTSINTQHSTATVHMSTHLGRGETTPSELGGPVPWSRVLLPFYRNKLDRSTQFGAVGYIITLYSSKSYVKSWGVCPNFGEVRTPRPPVVVHMVYTRNER